MTYPNLNIFDPTSLHKSNLHNGSFGMTDNRKRPREDDGSEFMPLSKRINNLHIHNRELVKPNVSSHSSDNSLMPSTSFINQQHSNDERRLPEYSPEIPASQNQYYYSNKLLFDMYIERLKRNGEQYPYWNS